MKYLAIDLETTGLDSDYDQILMISMVIEDSTNPLPLSSLPHFTSYIKHEKIKGSAFALGMNSWILNHISGRENYKPYQVLKGKQNWDYEDTGIKDTWIEPALSFLNEHFKDEKITLAGKNVGSFDLQFLPKELKDRFRHRVIDVGNMFIDFKNDKMVPDLSTCKLRAGLNINVAHDAYEDALDVIRLLRTRYA